MHSRERKLSGKALAVIVSYGVAAACLFWVFHNLNFRQLLHSFTGVIWWWVPVAMLFDLLVYFVAGWEWQILLRRAGRLPVVQSTQAVFAGRFANDVLPVHVGYLIRIYLVSRWTGASAASVAPSLAIERLFDGFWLALGIGLAAVFLPLPHKIAVAAELWTGIIVFGVITGAIIVFRKPKPRPAASKISWPKWAEKLRDAVIHALGQIRAIGRSWLLPAAFGLSFLKFSVQCLAFLFLLWAYRFHFPILVQLAVFLVAYAGLSMPSTPASVGVFQVFCIAGLELFHVPKGIAAGFALLAFAVLTLPLSVTGFFAMAQSGLTLRQIRSESGKWREARNRP